MDRLAPISLMLLVLLPFPALAAEGEGADAVDLGEVRVTPQRTVLDAGLAEAVVLAAEAFKLPLIDNDLFRAVQMQPGVQGGDFNSAFTVRGGERDETLVLLDGQELYSPFHLQDYGGALSVLDMLAVKEARLLLGGHGAEYGDRLSAVLEVQTKDPAEDLTVDAGIDVLNAHAFVSKDPFLLAFRAGYIGLFMSLIQSDEVLEPHYWDVLAKVDTRLANGDRVAAYGLYAGDLNRIEEPGDEEDVRSSFHNATSWVRWETDLAPHLHLATNAYGGWGEQHREEGTQGQDNRHLGYGGVKSVLTVRATRTVLFKLGGDLRWMRGRYRFQANDGPAAVNVEVEGARLAGFLQTTWRVRPGLDATFGIRALVLANEGAYGAPSAAVSWEPWKGVTLRAAWGIYLQPVDPLHLPVEAGVPDLGRPERAQHWLAGVQWRSKALGLNARVEVYRKEMDHLVGFIRDYGRKEQAYRPATSGWAEGVEVSVSKGFGTLARCHLGYTWAVAREEVDGHSVYRDNDRRHAGYLGVTVTPGKDWTVALWWRVHTGEPYTRVRYEGAARIEGPPNGGRLPPYHSLDLRVSKTWKLESVEISAYLQVLNLYNRTNVHEYSYAAEDVSGSTVYTRVEEGLFPILPTLGVNISF